MKASLVLTLFLFISCETDRDSSTHVNLIDYTEISKGALYGNGLEGIEKSNMVITNDDDWQILINKMNTVNKATEGFTETKINFNFYTLIAVFLDVKPNGWEIFISNIEEKSQEIIVFTTETEGFNLVINQPYHIVKIPKTHKQIQFQ